MIISQQRYVSFRKACDFRNHIRRHCHRLHAFGITKAFLITPFLFSDSDTFGKTLGTAFLSICTNGTPLYKG